MLLCVSDNIWIGDSIAGATAVSLEMDAVLNVAQDLRGGCGWPKVEYAHVGLIDGPGNPPCAYCAAVLMLRTLVERHLGKVMVYCHGGGRSLAVVLIYLIVKRGKTSEHSTFLNYWTPWDKVLKEIQERVDGLPDINKVHKESFDKLPLSLLEQLV